MPLQLMPIYNFAVIIEQDEDGIYLANVPDVPGCHTQAKSLPELYKRIEEALALCLEVQKKKKLPIPQIKFIGVHQLQIKV